MDLDSAFEKHGVWIEQFCTAIFDRNSLNAGTYDKDDNCELGKWLYGEGKKQYGKLNTYNNLISNHAEFHKVAMKVAQSINAKDYKSAEELLGENGEYVLASQAVHQAIIKLKDESHL